MDARPESAGDVGTGGFSVLVVCMVDVLEVVILTRGLLC